MQFTRNAGKSDLRQYEWVAQRRSKRSRTLQGTWGERKKYVPSFQPVGHYKDNGCFVPRWSNSSETNGLSCQVTGMGVFSVSAASCPSKPDSQVGHLSGMDCGRIHQRSAREQWARAASLSTVCRSHRLIPPSVGGCLLEMWISCNTYNILCVLGFKIPLASSCIPQLRTVNETFINHFS